MTNIQIYYGPKSGFEHFYSKQIFENDYSTLSTIVREVDELNKQHVVLVQGSHEEKPDKERIQINNLLINSDEYASVNEHVILNFEGFLSNIDVETIFLHNPPELLSKKLTKSFQTSTIETYKYQVLSMSAIENISSEFDKRIIGQKKVKESLINSLISQIYCRIKKPQIIMFYGPSGVGKTETAKFIAELLGGELFRKQLSMFQSNDFLSYLFGGFLHEKSFAKDLLERETNVILLDEFDKANSVFHSAFYQLFDEGIFVDKNYSVNIGNPIVICTSNYNDEEEIRKHLGDPIFSRFDSFIQFEKLSNDSIRLIISEYVKKEYDLLVEDAKSLIDVDKIIQMFEPFIPNLKNVRRIHNMIKNVIANEIRKKTIE